jgi:hypothetical protein
MLQSLIFNRVVGPMVRHGATALGGWLAANGYADGAAIEAITGGAVAAGGLLVSFAEKRFNPERWF